MGLPIIYPVEEHYSHFKTTFDKRKNRWDSTTVSTDVFWSEYEGKNILQKAFSYSLGCVFNSHSVITSSAFFVSLLLAFSVPTISVERSATGCGLFLLNKNLVQRGSSKSPSDVCSQWWGCIRTLGAWDQLTCFPALR